jgi:hypothetical protein
MNNYNENEVFEANRRSFFNVRAENYRWFLNTNIGLMLNKAQVTWKFHLVIFLEYTNSFKQKITFYFLENLFKKRLL